MLITEHWHRLLREVGESPSLEIFRSHGHSQKVMVLGSLLKVALLEQKGWTR